MKTEDRLRSSLARRAAQVAASDEDAWQAIVDRMQRRRGPSFQRAVAALVALAVAAAGVGFAVWALGRSVQRPATTVLPERIAFVKSGPRGAPGIYTSDLFTVSPDGTDLRNVTNSAAAEGPVSWSADGSTVAFVHQSAEEGAGALGLHAGVYVMRADGTGMREVVPCEKGYGRLPCDIRDIALSPNGSQLAYVRYGDELPRQDRIEVVGTDGTGYREIACPQCGLSIGHLEWSPDGTRLAFGGDLAGIIGGDIGPRLTPLYVADVRAGTIANIPDVTTGVPHPSWSPDGTRILFVWDRVSGLHGPFAPALFHTIAVISADGTGLRTILSCRQVGCSEPGPPLWSPDGRRFAFIDRTADGGEIWVVDVDGTVLEKLRPCTGGACLLIDGLVWSPDGRRLAFQALAENRQAWDLYVIDVGGSDLRRVAAPVGGILSWLPSTRIQGTGASIPGQTPEKHPSPPPYPPGLIAFAGDGGSGNDSRTAIYVVRPDGSGLRQLTDGKRSDLNPAWSPDGTRIAFDRPTKGRSIFVMNADGSGLHRLIDSPCGTVQPSWSPDGRSIAFIGHGPNCNRGAVFVMDIDSRAVQQITQPSSSTSDPAWSPDRRWIAFQRDGDLYLVRPDGSGLLRLTSLPGEESKPSWAPTGTSLSVVWYAGTADALYVIDADGTGLRPLTDLPGSQEGPAWAPDGEEVVFVHQDTELFTRVRVVTLDGFVRQPITPEGWAVYDPVWQPNA